MSALCPHHGCACIPCVHKPGRYTAGMPTEPVLPPVSGSPAQEGDARALQAGNDVLEQRVNELTRALVACNRQLEQFEHGVSHDLRAPLRAVNSFAELATGKLEADADPELRSYLQRIRDAATRADGLIDSLLELSRAGHSPLHLQVVDLSLLADWALVELQDADQERAASVHVQSGLSVIGDERLLRQLLQRILHNAWKFSDDNEPIRIDVGGELVDGTMYLKISDKGSGFDTLYAEKLFEPFQRLHGPEAGGGHGLGLAIARRIVARHGGQIRAQSSMGNGSTFHIELPAAPAIEDEQ